jgi:putative endonuclease
MAFVYILRGSGGRHYIGSTENLARRIHEHQSGGTHTTRRLGSEIALVVSREIASIEEARRIEQELKRKKNPRLAIHALSALPG